MRARHVWTGTLWVALYLGLALVPLGLILARPAPPGRGFWREFSVGLGFVGLSMMCLQFALTARFRWLKAPYGSDIVYGFHKHISLISVGMVLAHPVILLIIDPADMLRRLNPATMPPPARAGVAALGALVALVVISIWRRRLRLGYDTWRRAHLLLAVGAVALSVWHILLIDYYLHEPWERALWLIYVCAWIGLVVFVRVIKPWQETRTPYVVREVVAQRGACWTIRLAPEGHAGLRFHPGQFAWLTLFHSPFTDREHPFSFSGSAERPEVLEFTIKELGDFSRRIKEARPGQRAFLDGPFGALSADRHPHADAFGFIAGGIGITPMISHLRTFADRGERRPCTLYYAVRDWESATFREELEELAQRLPNVRIVYVLAQPHEGWTGERGFLTREILERHRPREAGVEYFICGPDPMMTAVERALDDMGVSAGDYHAERFNLA